jgi:hypothetical protein
MPNVYTVVLERISTGERAISMLTRQPTDEAAAAYAEAAIMEDPDLRIAEIGARFESEEMHARGSAVLATSVRRYPGPRRVTLG